VSQGRKALAVNFVAYEKNKNAARQIFGSPGLGAFFLVGDCFGQQLFIFADLHMSNRRRGRTARLRIINRSQVESIDHGKGS
jgi:hypothetical protein